MTWSIVSGRCGWQAAVLGLALLSGSAQAALFGDDEARKAILDLRQSVEQQRQQQNEQNAQLLDQVGQLRRSLLDTNNQLELTRSENARLRGQVEQLARDLSEAQLKLRDVDARLRRLEPQKASIDGKEFTADAEEIRQYEAAMTQVRNGDFAVAASSLSAFVSRWPASGYGPSALFWLGNAQYGKRDHAAAVASFRRFAAGHPDDPRAPEALLAVANCHFELKETKAARKALDELFKAYPKSEAAQAGKERLSALK
jgi:tol-pal system protein YbgF